MTDNFERMTSDEAPQRLKDFCFPKEESTYKHTPGPWTIYNHDGSNQGHYDGYLKTDIQAGADLIHVRQSVAAGSLPELAANVRLMAAAPSMRDALWAIANMQITENTDKGEVLALCMSIARLELEKCSVDHLADPMAAGAWQDGPAPKDGSHILALFRGDPYVVYWDSWQTGETIPGEGTYIDGEESGWIIARNGDALIDDEPEKWARIIHPNRHMPASWDGPGD